MLKNLINLPFKVMGKAARAVQVRQDAEMKSKHGTGQDGDDYTSFENIPTDEVPENFDAGPFNFTSNELSAAISANEELELVDVREEQDWKQETIIGACSMPDHTLTIRLAELAPMGVRIVFFCGDGKTSHSATRLMRFRGIENAWWLVGGLDAWKASGGSTEAGSAK